MPPGNTDNSCRNLRRRWQSAPNNWCGDKRVWHKLVLICVFVQTAAEKHASDMQQQLADVRTSLAKTERKLRRSRSLSLSPRKIQDHTQLAKVARDILHAAF